MREYREQELLVLAKRYRNNKRNYLLVDPLQGKHIPVSPGKALEMMSALGDRLAQMAPEIDLVIGFAETATAVGAAVAARLPEGCRYIHTTREEFARVAGSIAFQEEHSHATDQFLCADDAGEMLAHARGIAFVDDEISTGKTLLNIIQALRDACGGLEGKPIVAASIINRLDSDRIAAFEARGIRCCSLLHLPLTDYTQAVERYEIRGADCPPPGGLEVWQPSVRAETGDPRHGLPVQAYLSQCERRSAQVLDAIRSAIRGKAVTVLGTEEYMYPGLVLGRQIEEAGLCMRVDFHATTRSPIGICTDAGYPIRSGYRLRSFYDSNRCTYIYDLLPTDVAIVATDSPDREAVDAAMQDLAAALRETGCREIILIREGHHVRNIQEG